jgi:hypothetical protein
MSLRRGAALAESGAWESYVTTEVRIDLPGGAVRVFPAPPLQASGRYPDPAGRPIAVVTAHNPQGRVVCGEANAAAQKLLEDELTGLGLEWWPAAGADPSWEHVERSVAVPGLSEADALALGAKYDQEAVFILTPASRKVIDCVTGRRSITGWVIAPEADLAAEEFEAALEDDLDRLVTSRGPDPRDWDVPVLAESRWGAGDEGAAVAWGGAMAGGRAVAGEYLVRLGDRYVIYETEGVEWGWDHIDAPDDESAIAAFQAAVGEG